MRTRAIFKTVLLLILPAASIMTSCDPTALKGDGAVLTEIRDATGFTGVDISVPGEIHLTQGANFRVEIKAEENLLPFLETEVSGGKLFVYFSRNVRDVDGLEVLITLPALDKIQLSGSAQLFTHESFSGTKLALGVSGSGDIDLEDVQYDQISVNVSGSGSASMAGSAKQMDVQVSGSGEVRSLNCPAQTAKAFVSGSGAIWISVSEKLEAHISGSGDIWYEGNPALETYISGSGNIHKL